MIVLTRLFSKSNTAHALARRVGDLDAAHCTDPCQPLDERHGKMDWLHTVLVRALLAVVRVFLMHSLFADAALVESLVGVKSTPEHHENARDSRYRDSLVLGSRQGLVGTNLPAAAFDCVACALFPDVRRRYRRELGCALVADHLCALSAGNDSPATHARRARQQTNLPAKMIASTFQGRHLSKANGLESTPKLQSSSTTTPDGPDRVTRLRTCPSAARHVSVVICSLVPSPPSTIVVLTDREEDEKEGDGRCRACRLAAGLWPYTCMSLNVSALAAGGIGLELGAAASSRRTARLFC